MEIRKIIDALFTRTVVVDANVVTRGDAARAAAALGQEMIKRGWSKEAAGRIATHEFGHALGDLGLEGEIGLETDLFGRPIGGYYLPKGARTLEQKMRIVMQPYWWGRYANTMGKSDLQYLDRINRKILGKKYEPMYPKYYK